MTDLVGGDSSPDHARYEWLDQARGAIVVFLVVTMAASALTGGDRLQPVLAPTFLMHGSEVADISPRVITIVDQGAQMFVFLLGFVGYGAFTRRLKRGGAWAYAARRVLALLIIGIVIVAVSDWRGEGAYNWREALYEGTFAKLAIASFAGYLAIRFVPGARHRALIAALLMAMHMAFWEYAGDNVPFETRWLRHVNLPWGAWNTVAIAIVGTAFGQWVFTHPEGVGEGMRRYLFPGAVWCIVAYYAASWIQYAVHFELTTAHALGGIVYAQFLLLITYTFDRAGMRFPALTALGRNLLLLFLVGGIGTALYVELLVHLIPRELLAASPLGTFVLAGFLPYLVTISLGVFLDRKGIYLRV